MGDSELIQIEREGYISWLILNRPEKRNAFGMAFFTKLSEVMRQFDQDPDVRVIVVRAEGPSFSVGLDLDEAAGGSLFKGTGADDRETLRRKILEVQETDRRVQRSVVDRQAGQTAFLENGNNLIQRHCGRYGGDIGLGNRYILDPHPSQVDHAMGLLTFGPHRICAVHNFAFRRAQCFEDPAEKAALSGRFGV